MIAASVPRAGTVLPGSYAPLTKSLLAALAMLAAMTIGDGTPLRHFIAHGFGAAAWSCLARGAIAWLIPITVASLFLHDLRVGWHIGREITGAAAALTGVVLLMVCGRRDLAHLVLVHGGLLLLLPLLGLAGALGWARRAYTARRRRPPARP
jgi:hypothetical protein